MNEIHGYQKIYENPDKFLVFLLFKDSLISIFYFKLRAPSFIASKCFILSYVSALKAAPIFVFEACE